jgi:hypothetical protein
MANLLATLFLVLGVICISFSQHLFNERARNLAAKQDIEDITRKVEGVKAEILQASRIQETKYRLIPI